LKRFTPDTAPAPGVEILNRFPRHTALAGARARHNMSRESVKSRGNTLKVVFRKTKCRLRNGRVVTRWYVRLERSGRTLLWSEFYGRLRSATRMIEHLQAAVLNGQVKFEYHPRNDREVRRWIGELAMRPLEANA
jgi:hypothetical protein